MRKSLMIIAGLALFAGVSAAGAALLESAPKAKSAQTSDAVKEASLRHTHRHCHIVVTLGHAKKRCHTHRHNKVVHHGARYH